MSDAVEPPPSGWVPLFPLPDVVFFPHTLLPLHIFEPRYRRMLEDALAGDRLIVMALLQDGWEGDYEGRPAVHPVGCMGKITREQPLPDGRWNIILIGVARVRLCEERSDRPYRQVRIEILPDREVSLSDEDRTSARQDLIRTFLDQARREGKPAEALQPALQNIEDLGILTDVIASALPLPVEDRRILLEETDPLERVRRLGEYLGRVGARAREVRPHRLPYPPPLSDN